MSTASKSSSSSHTSVRPRADKASQIGARSFFRDNGLTIALLTVFVSCLVGQALTGWRVEVADAAEHGQTAAISFGSYLGSGPFLSALFENWESEFLQMWAYVMFTAYLFQRGSPESKNPDENEDDLGDPSPNFPALARKGGWVSKLYEHSLGGALLLLFLLSFGLHFQNSARAANAEALMHGAPPVTAAAYVGDPHFWFESMQNWQSEFFSTAVLIVLAIYLREKGSPESKKLYEPNYKTGSS